MELVCSGRVPKPNVTAGRYGDWTSQCVPALTNQILWYAHTFSRLKFRCSKFTLFVCGFLLRYATSSVILKFSPKTVLLFFCIVLFPPSTIIVPHPDRLMLNTSALQSAASFRAQLNHWRESTDYHLPNMAAIISSLLGWGFLGHLTARLTPCSAIPGVLFLSFCSNIMRLALFSPSFHFLFVSLFLSLLCSFFIFISFFCACSHVL